MWVGLPLGWRERAALGKLLLETFRKEKEQ
jgi:hypothetical protein